VTAWTPALSLDDRDARAPLFVRIAEAVSDDVRRGRLRRGTRLPGSRSLAKTLGVDRDTVTAAYRELSMQGWVEPRPARGVFVAASIPDATPRRASPARRRRVGVPEEPGFAFEGGDEPAPDDSPPRDGVIDLGNASPDLREFPVSEFARAMRRQLRLGGPALLGYGDPQGHARLRAALAAMLSARRGLAASADDVAVVRGSQMALALVARAIVRPGDVVAVESLGYRPAWSAFEDAGARLLHVPVDDEGFDVEALESALRKRPIRAVYVTPHHQYPTTVTLSAQRRLRLLDAARRHRFAVVEDDYDHEVHYEGRPVLPLASVDRDGLVVYVGTMSKTLAPSPRIGYVVAPRRLVRRIAALRRGLDRQGDFAVEAAVADLMEDGTVRRHLHRMQRLYRARRDALAKALATKLPGALTFRIPSGGMALWANAAAAIDVDAWARRAERRGLRLMTGSACTVDLRPIPHLRLGFSSLREDEIREAVQRMAATV